MIDVLPNNKKLINRAIRIITSVTNVSIEQAKDVLLKADKNVGLAIVMAKTGLNSDDASKLLEKNNNNVSQVLNN